MIDFMINVLLLTLVVHFCYVGYLFLGYPIKTIWQWIKHHPRYCLIDVTVRAPTFYFLLASFAVLGIPGSASFFSPASRIWLFLCFVGFVSSMIILFTLPARNYGEHSIDDENLDPNE